MECNKDHLTAFYGKSAQEDIPINSKGDFIELVNSGVSPSSGLRVIIDKYSLKNLDHSMTFALLRAAFPDIDLIDEGLSSRIIDTDYPNFTDGLTDVEFDEIVLRIKDRSASW